MRSSPPPAARSGTPSSKGRTRSESIWWRGRPAKNETGLGALVYRGGARADAGPVGAGCHTTGVETATKTFSAFGHDCYACHGVVDLNHTGDTKLMLLSKKRRDALEVVTSICAQCHLRGGKSRSTGLPYPNQFVAGDNLFKDYLVNFALADDANLNAGDRHVYRNVRDVVVNGSETTCLSCHKVHGQSTE